MSTSMPSLQEFLHDARAWLDEHAVRAPSDEDDKLVWGQGEFSVAVFHALDDDAERALLEKAKSWTQQKAERGYHAVSAPVEFGGLGYPRPYAEAFARLEREYVRPSSHETHSVTTRLIAPTIMAWGTDEQRSTFVPRFLAARELCCQLFSEPGAGSDLAGLGVPAVRDGDDMGGQRPEDLDLGRTVLGVRAPHRPHDPERRAKHHGTDRVPDPAGSRGVDIRPIRQMTGGSRSTRCSSTGPAFRIRLRLGPVGEGWQVALTTLGFER